jgi:hypothetical protein
VLSLLNDHLHAVGLARFMDALCSMADAMLWDTRVLWAANGVWPSEEDRYAADLGLVDAISDPFIREFTQAVLDAPIPIVTGGHALVSGGFLELRFTEAMHPMVGVLHNCVRDPSELSRLTTPAQARVSRSSAVSAT